MDMSLMSKFDVSGPGAGRMLDRLSANSVDGDPGTITYTQWLNERGLLEADLTVTKRDHDSFLVVATDTAHRHVEAHLHRAAGGSGAEVTDVTDVTSDYAQINLQGPHSRQVLQSVTVTDVSNEAFPFRTARRITIGSADVLCVRITYLGELGYELYVPANDAVEVHDVLVAAGRPLGLRPSPASGHILLCPPVKFTDWPPFTTSSLFLPEAFTM